MMEGTRMNSWCCIRFSGLRLPYLPRMNRMNHFVWTYNTVLVRILCHQVRTVSFSRKIFTPSLGKHFLFYSKTTENNIVPLTIYRQLQPGDRLQNAAHSREWRRPSIDNKNDMMRNIEWSRETTNKIILKPVGWRNNLQSQSLSGQNLPWCRHLRSRPPYCHSR